ncbi:MAG: hypothetical protein LC104_00490 [Bacteroidales bacterium]|nr:hypothetical protein [Bacteroidales bacterium]
MAYSITYLINVRGADFNQLLRPTHQADTAYFEEMVQGRESDLWDGMLPDDDMEFLVDLTGEWTLCKLPYPYSWLLNDIGKLDVLERVDTWELTLRALLPSKEIIRIDDFFFDQWNSRYDYLLVRYPQAVVEFIEWLRTQDHRYWTVLTTSRPA